LITPPDYFAIAAGFFARRRSPAAIAAASTSA
jgi:hypothetical protein